MNKYICSLFFLFITCTVQVYAERWPFDTTALEYVYPQYIITPSDNNATTMIPTAHIVSKELVYASADAKVIMASSLSAMDTDIADNTLILETNNGFHIAYYGITSATSIGSVVSQGDIVGKVTESASWRIRVFDIYKNQWVDPFSVFPVIDMPVIIKLHNFSFSHQSKNTKTFSVSDKILQAGTNTVDITLSVLEKKSLHYVIPQFIRITLQDTVAELWRDDILKKIDMQLLNKQNLIAFSLSDVVIDKGYFIADIFVHYSKESNRTFRFSLRAK